MGIIIVGMVLELRMLVEAEKYSLYPVNWDETNCGADRTCRELAAAHTNLQANGLYPANSLAWVQNWDTYAGQYSAEFKKMGVRRPPVLFFYDVENQTIVGNLKGSQIRKDAIVEKYKRLAALEPGVDQQSGMFGYKDTATGEFLTLQTLQTSGGGFSLISIPLFNFNLGLSDKIAYWAWLAAAGFFAFKTFDSDNPNKRALYGGLAGISGINFYNIKKRIDGQEK